MTTLARRPRQQPKPGQRLYWLAATLGLAMGAVVFAPARLLALLVPEASGQQVRLLNPRGTIWSGRTDLVLSGGAGSREAAALPRGLSWQLTPAWSAGPAIRLRLNAPCCTPQGLDLRLSWSGGSTRLQLERHASSWPAAWLTGLGAPWNTVDLQGRLQLQTEGSGVEWTRGRWRLNGPFELQALDLASSLSPLKPLGSYRLSVEPDAGGSPLIRLDTLDGALRLSGEGQWNGGRLRWRGLAEAAPDSVDALSNLLNILGRRDGARAHISLG
jgi:general secretion pathway protein N